MRSSAVAATATSVVLASLCARSCTAGRKSTNDVRFVPITARPSPYAAIRCGGRSGSTSGGAPGVERRARRELREVLDGVARMAEVPAPDAASGHDADATP